MSGGLVMRGVLIAITFGLGAAIVGACGKDTDTEDSQTHWLDECERDSECGGLSCECGRCVARCDASASCATEGRATRCFEPTDAAIAALCGPGTAPSLCLEPCGSSAPCPGGQACQGGACVPEAITGGAGAGGAGSGGKSSGGAMNGGTASGGATHGGEAGAGAAGGDPCASVPQCELLCPEPSINPTDENGCVHTCECVPPGGSLELKLYYTCGDPVCRGHTPVSTLPVCSDEMPGDDCDEEGIVCDPEDECNRRVTCATSDPQQAPGGCPISRRRYKRDIRYLDNAELGQYRDELLRMKLATWRYKHAAERERLGFIIDDNESSVAVDPQGDVVDLYGYTSLAVATIQLQAQQIEQLRREILELQQRLP